jgi:hypothetical protein
VIEGSGDGRENSVQLHEGNWGSPKRAAPK